MKVNKTFCKKQFIILCHKIRLTMVVSGMLLSLIQVLVVINGVQIKNEYSWVSTILVGLGFALYSDKKSYKLACVFTVYPIVFLFSLTSTLYYFIHMLEQKSLSVVFHIIYSIFLIILIHLIILLFKFIFKGIQKAFEKIGRSDDIFTKGVAISVSIVGLITSFGGLVQLITRVLLRK